jgi:small subunit ribosomal protein S6
MTEKASYDLMVLLDPEAPEERRTQLVEQIRERIRSADATLNGDADWGMRRLAYEIDHRTEAHYHLFQFEAAPDVLSNLDRSLSIDDAVLRFRTIRLPGKAPEQTPPAPPQTSFESGRREGGRGRDDRGERGDRRGPEQRSEGAPEGPSQEPEAAPPAEAPEAPAEATEAQAAAPEQPSADAQPAG